MKWYLGREKNQFVIRGWPGNKRHPAAKYAAFRHDEEQLKAYIQRLNAPTILREKVELRHAFINDALLTEYLDFLKTKIPSEAGATTELSYLRNHALKYFINDLGLINPADWYAVSETKWAAYLLKHQKARSAKTKRDVVNALNRFIKWLHRKRPDEVPLVTFEPISRAKYAEIEARRAMSEEVLERRYVEPEHLKRILKNLPDKILGHVSLAAHYGLRRNETLGVRPGDVKHGYLSIERQLRRLGVVGPVKGRKSRKVPHWFSSAAQAYQWVELVTANPMHPRTLAAAWDALMRDLELPYNLHDLRHTWITNSVRKHAPRDVQLAAGHKDLRITMAYLKDDRDLDDEEWKPAG
jgi:hypothetical protein